jgi:hypothetical protein
MEKRRHTSGLKQPMPGSTFPTAVLAYVIMKEHHDRGCPSWKYIYAGSLTECPFFLESFYYLANIHLEQRINLYLRLTRFVLLNLNDMI